MAWDDYPFVGGGLVLGARAPIRAGGRPLGETRDPSRFPDRRVEPYVPNYPGPAQGEDPGPPEGEYDVQGDGFGAPQMAPSPQQPRRAPGQGPLARFGSKVLGGLANFAQNADFNGAYLAGRGEYAAADASNERFAADQKERHNKAIHDQMVARLRGIDPTTTDGNREAFAIAMEFGDQKMMDWLVKMQLRDTEYHAPISVRGGVPGKPGMVADSLYDPRLKSTVYTGNPYELKSGVTVNTGAGGLKPGEAAANKAKYLDDYNVASAPFQEVDRRTRELENLFAAAVDESGQPRELNPMESYQAAVAFSKELKPAESIMKDDIDNLLGQGWENWLRDLVDVPKRLTREQLDMMRQVSRQVNSLMRERQGLVENRYRTLLDQYGETAPSYLNPAPPPGGGATDASGPPEGARLHPTVPGLWVLPDGSGWQE